jgi:hypothetical protein
MGTQKEMVRVHATPLIATMADVHASGNGAVLDLPGQAVGELDDAFAGQLAITVVIEACLPDQAAGYGIGFGVAGQALLCRPRRRAGRILSGSNAGGFTHARAIGAQRFNYLLWAMAFAIP